MHTIRLLLATLFLLHTANVHASGCNNAAILLLNAQANAKKTRYSLVTTHASLNVVRHGIGVTPTNLLTLNLVAVPTRSQVHITGNPALQTSLALHSLFGAELRSYDQSEPNGKVVLAKVAAVGKALGGKMAVLSKDGDVGTWDPNDGFQALTKLPDTYQGVIQIDQISDHEIALLMADRVTVVGFGATSGAIHQKVFSGVPHNGKAVGMIRSNSRVTVLFETDQPSYVVVTEMNLDSPIFTQQYTYLPAPIGRVTLIEYSAANRPRVQIGNDLVELVAQPGAPSKLAVIEPDVYAVGAFSTVGKALVVRALPNIRKKPAALPARTILSDSEDIVISSGSRPAIDTDGMVRLMATLWNKWQARLGKGVNLMPDQATPFDMAAFLNFTVDPDLLSLLKDVDFQVLQELGLEIRGGEAMASPKNGRDKTVSVRGLALRLATIAADKGIKLY